MLNDGTECEAKDLKGKRLMPFYNINQEIDEFVKYGFIQGDGSTGRLDSSAHKALEIYFGENDADVANIFGFQNVGKQYVSGFNMLLKSLGFSSKPLPERRLPNSYKT